MREHKMEDKIITSGETNSFTSAMALTETGLKYVPKNYVLPPSQRPKINSNVDDDDDDHQQHPSDFNLPLIDLTGLENPLQKPRTISQLRLACERFGCFQVINHGIPQSVTKDTLAAASEFFDLPNEEKMSFMSLDFLQPVRYGTSLNLIQDKVHFWRDFIKHYSHPLPKWIDLWPSNPPTYKKKMGDYAKAVHLLQKQLMEVISESLGLNPDYLHNDIEEGCQTIVVNCYPACPEPELALGLPPHSDFGTITILLQNLQGLETMNHHDKKWHAVPVIKGALVVQLGDQIEIMSNGRYKSVIHRAVLNSQARRISIASLHSLALEKKIGPAPELVKQEEEMYKQGSYNDFLNFLSSYTITEGRYIDTKKKNPSG